MAAHDHTRIEMLKPRRVPTRSKSLPETPWPIVYATRNQLLMEAKPRPLNFWRRPSRPGSPRPHEPLDPDRHLRLPAGEPAGIFPGGYQQNHQGGCRAPGQDHHRDQSNRQPARPRGGDAAGARAGAPRPRAVAGGTGEDARGGGPAAGAVERTRTASADLPAGAANEGATNRATAAATNESPATVCRCPDQHPGPEPASAEQLDGCPDLQRKARRVAGGAPPTGRASRRLAAAARATGSEQPARPDRKAAPGRSAPGRRSREANGR